MPLSGRGGCDLYGMPSPLILAPLERFGDMPECCTVGRWRQKYGGWAGYDNRHLVAAQLAIDAIGGVATPDRNQGKKNLLASEILHVVRVSKFAAVSAVKNDLEQHEK